LFEGSLLFGPFRRDHPVDDPLFDEIALRVPLPFSDVVAQHEPVRQLVPGEFSMRSKLCTTVSE
jgi:hypothetical protein